ncbi:MAG: replication initiation protein [Alphaproteobacteria bacterium]
MTLDSKNSIVKKHNTLIEAQYTKKMDVRAVRIVALTAAKITRKDKDFQTYHIPVKSITSSSDVYKRAENDHLVIENITEQLMSNVIRLPKKDMDGKFTGNSFVKYQYFSKCEYIVGSGYLEVEFHPDLRPLFLNLKDNFTKLSLEILCSLPSTYSYRLYELLKQYAQGGIMKRIFKLPELQDMLGIKPGLKSSFRKFGKFREKVLLPAQANFQKHTDLLFEFKAWADYGRAYTHIEFTMSKNKKYIQENLFKSNPSGQTPPPYPTLVPDELIKLIPEEQWNNKRIGCQQVCMEILKDQGEDALKFYIEHTKQLDKKEKRASWGKTIRIAWQNKLYEANFEELAVQEEKQQKVENNKKIEKKEQEKKNKKIKNEQKKNNGLDSVVRQILESDSADQFKAFINAQVNENETKYIRQRFLQQNKGAENLYRKYLDGYLKSILNKKG